LSLKLGRRRASDSGEEASARRPGQVCAAPPCSSSIATSAAGWRERQQQPFQRVQRWQGHLLVHRVEPGVEVAEMVEVVANERADDSIQISSSLSMCTSSASIRQGSSGAQDARSMPDGLWGGTACIRAANR